VTPNVITIVFILVLILGGLGGALVYLYRQSAHEKRRGFDVLPPDEKGKRGGK
jgi:hypothetical protein